MQVDEKKYAEMVAKAEKMDKVAAINKKSYERRTAKIHLLLDKAAKAKITVTEAEVDAYLAKK